MDCRQLCSIFLFLFPFLSLISCPVSVYVHTVCRTSAAELQGIVGLITSSIIHPWHLYWLMHTHTHTHTDSYLTLPQRPIQGCPNPGSIAVGDCLCGVCVCRVGVTWVYMDEIVCSVVPVPKSSLFTHTDTQKPQRLLGCVGRQCVRDTLRQIEVHYHLLGDWNSRRESHGAKHTERKKDTQTEKCTIVIKCHISYFTCHVSIPCLSKSVLLFNIEFLQKRKLLFHNTEAKTRPEDKRNGYTKGTDTDGVNNKVKPTLLWSQCVCVCVCVSVCVCVLGVSVEGIFKAPALSRSNVLFRSRFAFFHIQPGSGKQSNISFLYMYTMMCLLAILSKIFLFKLQDILTVLMHKACDKGTAGI